jgi:hypothetical protein
MINQDNILNELRGLNSDLPPGNNLHPYSVPEGYFEGLAESILAKVTGQASAKDEIASLSPFLAGLSRTMPYSVPENYFSENMEGLEGLTTDVESIPLTFASKQPPYEAPSGYFDTLAENVLARVKPQAKIIPLYRRGWMRAAVAAVVVGIMTFAGLNYFGGKQNNGIASNNNTVQQSTTPEKLNPAIAKELNTVSTEELDAFIKKVDAVDTVSKSSVVSHSTTKKDKLRSMLKDVSNDELDNFLNQVPTASEEALLTD